MVTSRVLKAPEIKTHNYDNYYYSGSLDKAAVIISLKPCLQTESNTFHRTIICTNISAMPPVYFIYPGMIHLTKPKQDLY